MKRRTKTTTTRMTTTTNYDNDDGRSGVGGGSGGGDGDRDEDGDSKVDRYEFCSYMLVNLGKIDQDDVDQVMSLFKHYDLDGSGTITIDDVVQVNTIEGTAPA